MRTKYELIRVEILNALRRGEWQPGDQLPPLPELSVRYGASRWATERALTMLINEGLLTRKPKKGTYVRHAAVDKIFEVAPLAVIGVGPDKWLDGDYLGPLMGSFAAELGERDWVFLQYGSLHRAAERLQILGAALVVAVTPSLEDIPVLEEMAAAGFQVLCLGAKVQSSRLHYVAVDNIQGILLGLRYLHQLGHHSVGFIGTLVHSYDTKDRLAGFRQGVKALGMNPDPSLVICDDRPGGPREIVTEAIDRLFSRSTPPTAIFTGGGGLTGEVLSELSARGISFPGDVSLIAFDDSPFFMHLSTPLTAICQPLQEIGRRAAHVLSLLSGNTGNPIQLALPTELTVRSSCAHPWKGVR